MLGNGRRPPTKSLGKSSGRDGCLRSSGRELLRRDETPASRPAVVGCSPSSWDMSRRAAPAPRLTCREENVKERYLQAWQWEELAVSERFRPRLYSMSVCPDQLSGGMAHGCLCVCTLSCRPRLLLLMDEPLLVCSPGLFAPSGKNG